MLRVKSDNASFFSEDDTQDAPQQTSPQAGQQDFPPSTESPPIEQQTNETSGSPLRQVENELDEVEGIEDIEEQINQLNTPETQTTEPTETQTDKPEDELSQGPEFEAFQAEFKKYMGVDLKEARTAFEESQRQLVQVSQQVQQTYNQLAIMQQKVELQSRWASDPEVQRLMANNSTTLGQIVDNRVATLQKVYSRLSPEAKQSIDRLDGVEAVVQLWNIYNRKNAGRVMPGSNVAPPTNRGDLKKLSEIENMPEAQFRTEGLELLRNRQFIDDYAS